MATHLNKNIMVFDVELRVDKALLKLAQASGDPDYIVLRRPRPEAADRFWFYVFKPEALLEYMKAAAELVNDGVFPSLRECLPQLHETDAAPVVPANISLPRWSERYDATSWIGLGYPVAVGNNQPKGVWEQTEAVHRGTFSDTLGNIDFSNVFDSGSDSPPVTRGVEEHGFESLEASPAEEDDAAPPLTPVLTPTPATQTLYPSITTSNKSPVMGEALNLKISLEKQRVRDTAGGAVLPVAAADFVFEIDVHLLCGENSLWDTMQYHQSKGTTKPAEFNFTAPDVGQDKDGYYLEREKLPVTVNFYYQNRWCGEGLRYLDLRQDESFPAKIIPPPKATYWGQYIYMEDGAQPPDLLVRIQKMQADNQYQWTCLSPHMQFDNSLPSVMSLPKSAEDFAYQLFESYAHKALSDIQADEIEGSGTQIYKSTPEVFKQAYQKLMQASQQPGSKITFRNILIITDEPYIPWELMRLSDGQKAELLAVRHAVGRWVAGVSSRLPQQIRVEHMAVSGSDYVGNNEVGPPLPWVKGELEWLEQNYAAQPIPLQANTLQQFLEQGNAQALHVACHGRIDTVNPLQSQLWMEHAPHLTPLIIIRDEVKTGLGAKHPLVFLNACQVGSQGDSLSLMAGFPGAFLEAGASAVICPLWTVNDEHAKNITESFYKAAFKSPGATLGEILQEVRSHWAEQSHLTFLAYVLYGDPQAKVYYQHS